MDKRIGDVRHQTCTRRRYVVIEWNDPYSDDATRQEEIKFVASKKWFTQNRTLVFLFIRCVRLWYQESLVVLSH